MAKADLDKNPFDVASMFDAVGEKYDLTNTVLSFGQDRRWRRRTRERLNLKPGEKVLDLAAGTAVSTVELSKSGAWCVACDFSQGMLAAGRDRNVPKVVGDGMNLPFEDNSFDAVTISYGLRNIHDHEAALREMARVTKPGGRLTIAEFSTPVVPVFSTVYKEYLMRLIPPMARAVSSNPEAYIYLAESIRAWPGQEELARRINANGWSEAGWQNLSLGIVAMHSALKPHSLTT
ncbi:demethylmenaquinone methyltransferase [Corynebacterium testudinoris]|uniref:Demethylmenaquinone methyltransferase n=1 Tax=Corynebacterium testudinoris TaxID=136857 RepID=A0A0G3H336_9CORY|nr:demethylmenaquinone methyltransferase [Corynebacterium testudinoris]AKK07821.1 ubiquinone/menaquinone biosynthesis methyltransferase [Corynebacterium testudinoris]MBX8997046.1 demethylmenaquinone methyltransferase [Corynebacterium testudinoris]